MPITRRRNLPPRKNFGLVFVAYATPERRRPAQWSNSCLPLPARRAGQAPAIASPPARNGGLTTDWSLQDSSKILWQTPLSTRPPRTGTPDIIAARAQPRAGRRRCRALALARRAGDSDDLRRTPAWDEIRLSG